MLDRFLRAQRNHGPFNIPVCDDSIRSPRKSTLLVELLAGCSQGVIETHRLLAGRVAKGKRNRRVLTGRVD